MSKKKPGERVGRVAFRAELLAEADRSSAAAVSRKYGVHPDTIRNWRRDLEEDHELARLYAETVQRLHEEWQKPLVEVMHASLARMMDLIPNIGAEDLRVLLDVVREIGSLKVQADALVPPSTGKAGRGSAPDREGPQGAADASGDRPLPIH